MKWINITDPEQIKRNQEIKEFLKKCNIAEGEFLEIENGICWAGWHGDFTFHTCGIGSKCDDDTYTYIETIDFHKGDERGWTTIESVEMLKELNKEVKIAKIDNYLKRKTYLLIADNEPCAMIKLENKKDLEDAIVWSKQQDNETLSDEELIFQYLDNHKIGYELIDIEGEEVYF